MLLAFAFIGWAGNNAYIRNLSESESKVTEKKLINNWSDYHIMYRDLPSFLIRKTTIDQYCQAVKKVGGGGQLKTRNRGRS